MALERISWADSGYTVECERDQVMAASLDHELADGLTATGQIDRIS